MSPRWPVKLWIAKIATEGAVLTQLAIPAF